MEGKGEMIIILFALLAASLFAGAALYISLVEHPARLALGDAPLLAQWQPSYRRALPIQAGLALAGGLAGLAAWVAAGSLPALAGGLLLLANWPFTMLAIMPVNKRLLAMNQAEAGAESRKLLLGWGRLHAVRSALGAASASCFLLAAAIA